MCLHPFHTWPERRMKITLRNFAHRPGGGFHKACAVRFYWSYEQVTHLFTMKVFIMDTLCLLHLCVEERADNILFLFIDHWPIGSYKQTWWEEWESFGNTQHWTRFKDWIGIGVISVHRGRIKWIFHDEKGKMYQIKSYAFITVLFLLFLAAKLHCLSHPSLENCCVFSS